MKRILIIGNSGAGKSTVSRAIGARLKMPVIYLDEHRWVTATEKLSQEAFEQKLRPLIGPNCWVMDGNYTASLPLRLSRADTVVYLDLPRSVCFRRVLIRYAADIWRGRPRYSDGRNLIPLWSQGIDFLRFVWRYPIDTKPTVERRLSEHHAVNIVRLMSQSQIDQWLATLAPADQS